MSGSTFYYVTPRGILPSKAVRKWMIQDVNSVRGRR
jgi:hypothetical protein